MEITPVQRESFEAKIDKSDECWLWTGAIGSTGYGVFSVYPNGREYAHRIAYILENGEIPPERFVLHTCDVKACVRPSHLFAGTHLENMADMRSKGRSGGRPWAKLNERSVRDIRQLLRDGMSHREIAQRFGVSAGAIHQVRTGKAWAWVN